MQADFTAFNLLDAPADIPAQSILSRTLYADEQVKTVLFAFSAGQELSEHTASSPAILHILKGEARLMLGGEALDARAGTWVHMPAHLPHGVLALSPVTMLLLLLKAPVPGGHEER